MKKKSIILSVVLALIVCLSSVALFGCAKKTSIKKTYFKFDEVVNYIKDDNDDTLTNTSIKFKTYTDSGEHSFETIYSLNDFGPVKSSQLQLTGYTYYPCFIAYGLEFIEKYYPQIENVTKKMNYENLYNSINGVKSSYDALKKSHTNLLDYNNVHEIIYNGSFYTYRKNAATFIDKIYTCANNLANFLYNDIGLGKKVGKEGMTDKDFAFYYDFNILHAIDDFKLLFMKSYKGISLYDESDKNGNGSGNFYKALSAFNIFFGEVGKLSAKEGVTVEEANEFKTLMDRVAASRKNAQKACNSLSLYDYNKKYNKSIEAYEKDKELAHAYLDTLEDYYFKNMTSVRGVFGNYKKA